MSPFQDRDIQRCFCPSGDPAPGDEAELSKRGHSGLPTQTIE